MEHTVPAKHLHNHTALDHIRPIFDCQLTSLDGGVLVASVKQPTLEYRQQSLFITRPSDKSETRAETASDLVVDVTSETSLFSRRTLKRACWRWNEVVLGTKASNIKGEGCMRGFGRVQGREDHLS